MSKLLKADIYRLFRTKAFYVCLIIMYCIIGLNAVIIKMSHTLGIEGEIANYNGITFGLEMLTISNIKLFMGIFIAVFVASEFNFGTMKNLVSKGFDRAKIYLSKLITMSIASIIMVMNMFLVAILVVTFATGELGEITSSYLLEILRLLAIELLLYVALGSVFLMIAMVIRSSGGAIAINILGVITFYGLIYELLNRLFKEKYNFHIYSLQGNIMNYYNNISPPLEDMIRSIVVGGGLFNNLITFSLLLVFLRCKGCAHHLCCTSDSLYLHLIFH